MWEAHLLFGGGCGSHHLCIEILFVSVSVSAIILLSLLFIFQSSKVEKTHEPQSDFDIVLQKSSKSDARSTKKEEKEKKIQQSGHKALDKKKTKMPSASSSAKEVILRDYLCCFSSF